MNFYRGLVVETSDHFAIVLDYGGGFRKIKIKDGLQEGQVIYYLDEDLYEEEFTSKPQLQVISGGKKRRSYRWIALAASILLVISGALAYTNYDQNHRVYAAISMAGEEGVDLTLNKAGQVISASKDSGKLKGKNINELKDYFTNELPQVEDLVVTTAYKDQKQGQKTDKLLKDWLTNNQQEVNIIIFESDFAIYQAAAKAKKSLADYQIDQLGLNLWKPGAKLTAQEKQDRLKGQAEFYQVGPDKEQIRRDEKNAEEEAKKRAEEEKRRQEERERNNRSRQFYDDGEAAVPENSIINEDTDTYTPPATSEPAPSPAPIYEYDDDWDDDYDDWDDYDYDYDDDYDDDDDD